MISKRTIKKNITHINNIMNIKIKNLNNLKKTIRKFITHINKIISIEIR